MKIKITCTQAEFAQLVRACAGADIGDYCHACVLYGYCNNTGIDNCAEIKIVEGGADNG